MSINLLRQNENAINKFYLAHLPKHIKYQGVECNVYRSETTAEVSVYGINAGVFEQDTPIHENVKVLFTNYQWRVISEGSDGYYDLSDEFVYANIELQENDLIKISPDITRTTRLATTNFRIINSEVLGIEQTIISKFRISTVEE